MIINKLIIKRDNGLLKDDLFEFSFGNKTVIYSKDNSVGKTSLLRFIVFALGFKVPSTPGINMNLYTVLLYITNNFGSYYLKREQNKIGIYSLNNELINQYNVFDETQQKSLLKFIFNLNDFSIYNELLGCFFIEQDSGWNITNKGRILLYNKFSLTDLISNLNSNLLQPIKNELLRLRREQNKYRAIYICLFKPKMMLHIIQILNQLISIKICNY